MKEKYDIIIIGGGVAGLSTGAWLAYKGLDVIVLEQREKPGGMCTTFERAGTFYNPAATILTGYSEGNLVRKYCQVLDIEKDMEVINLDCAFKTILPEHTVYLWPEVDKTISDLCRMFPEERQKINELFIKIKKVHQEVNSIAFLGPGLIDFFKVPFKCPNMLPLAGKTTTQFLSNYFSNQKLQAALTGVLPAFMGPPSKVAAVSYIMLMMEFMAGELYTPKGGIIKFPQALNKALEKYGGETKLNSQVTNIIIENNRATGVDLADGQRLKAKYIIAACDATTALLKLAGKNHLKPAFIKRIEETPTSPCLLVSYMSLDKDLLKAGYTPAHHLVSHTYNYDELYDNLEARMYSESDYNHSLNLASIADPSLSPEGFSTLQIQLNVPYQPQGGWKKIKENIGNIQIKRAKKVIPDIEEHIVVQEIASPRSFETITGSRYGAVGWAPYPQYTGINALHHITPIKNLYLAGQWAEPGEAIKCCVLSGLQVSKMILDREGLKNSIDEIL
ncbi:NAD(P)/FAD-dependent oxidoreductase [bacterium]|nr:NAD(P)/FAD-dependent oxidoreductase [bacterium]